MGEFMGLFPTFGEHYDLGRVITWARHGLRQGYMVTDSITESSVRQLVLRKLHSPRSSPSFDKQTVFVGAELSSASGSEGERSVCLRFRSAGSFVYHLADVVVQALDPSLVQALLTTVGLRGDEAIVVSVARARSGFWAISTENDATLSFKRSGDDDDPLESLLGTPAMNHGKSVIQGTLCEKQVALIQLRMRTAHSTSDSELAEAWIRNLQVG